VHLNKQIMIVFTFYCILCKQYEKFFKNIIFICVISLKIGLKNIFAMNILFKSSSKQLNAEQIVSPLI
jgi:hypothetical protein